jgi:hypothetical protein
MKKTGKTGKRVLATIVAAGILSIGVTAFAAVSMTPAEIAASVTGKTIAAVQTERATGKTYGTIAKDAGQLDAFKAASLESKKAILDQQVKDGKITQAQADVTYNALKAAQATCDGTGTAQIGKNNGIGFGSGSGLRDGTGAGTGNGRNSGGGLRDGTGAGRGRGTGTGMHR